MWPYDTPPRAATPPSYTFPTFVGHRMRELTAAQQEHLRFNRLSPVEQLNEQVAALTKRVAELEAGSK